MSAGPGDLKKMIVDVIDFTEIVNALISQLSNYNINSNVAMFLRGYVNAPNKTNAELLALAIARLSDQEIESFQKNGMSDYLTIAIVCVERGRRDTFLVSALLDSYRMMELDSNSPVKHYVLSLYDQAITLMEQRVQQEQRAQQQFAQQQQFAPQQFAQQQFAYQQQMEQQRKLEVQRQSEQQWQLLEQQRQRMEQQRKLELQQSEQQLLSTTYPASGSQYAPISPEPAMLPAPAMVSSLTITMPSIPPMPSSPHECRPPK